MNLLQSIQTKQDSKDHVLKLFCNICGQALESGVTILHYHPDNGRFCDNAFQAACEQEGQHLTFCGVHAQFQNGKAEKAF